ncbi:MAG TPA: gluconokinase [Intrasporangiaceae bacterium]|nr:gluconokinase [Intrasporangiaceae bacterium]
MTQTRQDDTSEGTSHIVVMGVSGSGKTTIAHGVADRLGWEFAEADDFHPQRNIDKMSAGIPLDDDDRGPWLEDVAAWMAARAADGRSTVVACSALKRSYRDILRDGPPRVGFVHLDGPIAAIGERLSGRTGHFMPASLLQSQVDALEPLDAGEHGIQLDLRQTPDQLIAAAVDWIETAF